MTVKDVLFPEYPPNYVCFSLQVHERVCSLVEATWNGQPMTDEHRQMLMGILRQLNAAAQLCDVRPVKPMIVMEAA